MDYQTLLIQRNTHPAWRLLAAVNALLVASFLYRSFIKSSVVWKIRVREWIGIYAIAVNPAISPVPRRRFMH